MPRYHEEPWNQDARRRREDELRNVRRSAWSTDPPNYATAPPPRPSRQQTGEPEDHLITVERLGLTLGIGFMLYETVSALLSL